ncbi:DUF563 domain-containing protein [Roseibium sp. RKSG952]|uniref:glycosyltransferase family 61 protein n=1 Tax=Roseibium sp. RKSG952 TaxID=2529384 RepID=UPI0018AD28C6|nr:glycosyltransferase family 61 protein [Roseibium sp. RKSG952]
MKNSFLVESLHETSKAKLGDQDLRFIKTHGNIETMTFPDKIVRQGNATIDVYRFRNCAILGKSGETVLLDGPYNLHRPGQNTARFGKLRRRKIDGPVLNLLGYHKGHKHYYNFLATDLDEQLAFFERQTKREAVTALVREDISSIQRSIYTYLERKYKFLRIEEVGPNERIEADICYTIKSRNGSRFRSPQTEQGGDRISTAYKAAYNIKPCKTPWRKVYVARDDAKIRRIQNEQDLWQRLEPLGFERIIPGTMSHAEQVRLFDEAKVIVGAHGAGLTNLLFTQEGGQVVELFPANYVQSSYLWMSRLKQHHYTPVICGKSQAHQHFQVSENDIASVLDALREVNVFEHPDAIRSPASVPLPA